MSPKLSPKVRRVSLALLLVAVTGLVSVCDQPSEVAVPDNLTPQMAPGGATTTVRFVATRGGPPDAGGAVIGATISVYFNKTNLPTVCSPAPAVNTSNCWLFTNEQGFAEIEVPNGTSLCYLARVLPPNWVDAAEGVWPPVSPPAADPAQPNDLGALTAGRRDPVPANAAALRQCVDNLFVTPRGSTFQIDLVLPVAKRGVSVIGVDGADVSNLVYAYLIEPLLPNTFDWLKPCVEVNNAPGCLTPGTKAGFLRYYGLAGPGIPHGPGFVEVFEQATNFQFAGTSNELTLAQDAVVNSSPVICANDTQAPASAYSLTPKPAKGDFSFTAAKWAYGATRDDESENALDRDLTTSVVVIEFDQKAGTTATIDISQRHRTPDATKTVSVSFTCTGGICDVNVTPSAPGAGNLLQAFLFQPKPGKVFWVVRNLDPIADSEWSAKAGGVQLPESSKSNASSAFLLFSKAFTFCDPDFSFDGGWGCGI